VTVGVGDRLGEEIRVDLIIPSPPPHCVVSVVSLTVKVQLEVSPVPVRMWVESSIAHVLWKGPPGTPAPRQI
jgi:hypothetical protein